jgi:hypothetical protein
MTISIGNLITTLSLSAATIIAIGTALMYFGSRFRRAADALQKDYIAALERDRRELQSENKELRTQVGELRGAVDVLKQMVMGLCRSFSEDPATGGCSHCGLGLAYGQRTRIGNGDH